MRNWNGKGENAKELKGQNMVWWGRGLNIL